MKDIIALVVAIVLCLFLLIIGYLAIFNPMKIINYYADGSTDFMTHVKQEELSCEDILKFKIFGTMAILMALCITAAIVHFIVSFKN